MSTLTMLAVTIRSRGCTRTHRLATASYTATDTDPCRELEYLASRSRRLGGGFGGRP
jgi:hypothetical protein